VTDAGRRPLQQDREVFQDLTAVDASRRIVWRINDDKARPWADRRVDRTEIELASGSLERNLARHGSRSKQQRFVAEPGRLGKNRFVTGLENLVYGELL
jgi:hypothetical protein